MIILIEMIFIIAFGCVLHFTYEWAHHDKIVGWLSAVNESTWEHIKLAILPGFLTMLFDYWFFGDNPNYWLAKFLMLFSMIVIIPAVFYLNKMICKHDVLVIDIMIFCLAVVYAVLIFNWVLSLGNLNAEWIGLVGLVFVFAAFAFLTYFPFKNFLFVDPRNKKYGFDAHECYHVHSYKHKK